MPTHFVTADGRHAFRLDRVVAVHTIEGGESVIVSVDMRSYTAVMRIHPDDAKRLTAALITLACPEPT